MFLISDDCWSTGVYKFLKTGYESPFVNLFIHTPCYITLLENFDEYINHSLELISSKSSKYGFKQHEYIIGKIKDIEIHFSHSKINEKNDVLDKWNKRIERLPKNKDEIIFKLGTIYHYAPHNYDNDYNKYIERFYKLPFKKKISFTKKKYEFENNFQMKPNHICDALSLGLSVNTYLNIKDFNE